MRLHGIIFFRLTLSNDYYRFLDLLNTQNYVSHSDTERRYNRQIGFPYIPYICVHTDVRYKYRDVTYMNDLFHFQRSENYMYNSWIRNGVVIRMLESITGLRVQYKCSCLSLSLNPREMIQLQIAF